MKKKHRNLYIASMILVVARRCSGVPWPIVVDGLKLLNESCRRWKSEPEEEGGGFELPHTYSRDDSARVVQVFFDGLAARCQITKGSTFPVYVQKAPGRLVEGIGHGKPLTINEEFTAEWYRENAYPVSGDRNTGFILFAQQVNKQHPVLAASMLPYSRRVNTEVNSLRTKVNKARDAKLLNADTAKRLLPKA